MAIARKKAKCNAYDAAILKYREMGYWVAQDANGKTMAYFYTAGIAGKKWIGPPAFVIHDMPKCKDWKDSYRQPIGTYILDREKQEQYFKQTKKAEQ